MATRTDWSGTGGGTSAVMVIPNYMVTLSDGVKLSLRIWYPSNTLEGTPFQDNEHYLEWDPSAKFPSNDDDYQRENPMESPVPAILEYLPYRHSDYYLESDFNYHTWMCSHGYVCVRADIRGSGCSQGRYHGEYLAQEQKDGVEVIQWMASQPWCNGSVGMSGHSWGGFNGLQLAFLKPPPLKVSGANACSFLKYLVTLSTISRFVYRNSVSNRVYTFWMASHFSRIVRSLFLCFVSIFSTMSNYGITRWPHDDGSCGNVCY